MNNTGDNDMTQTANRHDEKLGFISGYWVTLSYTGLELSREFSLTKEGVGAIIVGWSKDLDDGDTIAIRKGVTEGLK